MADPRVLVITGTRKGIGRHLAEYYCGIGDAVARTVAEKGKILVAMSTSTRFRESRVGSPPSRQTWVP